MAAPIISVRNLGKRYQLGAALGHDTLRDHIAHAAQSVTSLFRGKKDSAAAKTSPESFWALQDVSFDVQPGEAVGIIGRNGAGKSTCLKLLSQITEPTTGEIRIRGKLASLLEVGTGFHPELSGRENIFLNGAILGMSKAEIVRHFDEIVAFAEIGKFLDTPVKRYSSGMYVRLAFAVAAHLEAEILVVDEVLAVGDLNFQRKCLAKIQDVGQSGRTVLFVSHNMSAITRLCQRTILLDGGRVLRDGPSHDVVKTYLTSGLGTTAHREWPDAATAPGNDVVRLRAVRVRGEDGQVREALDIRQSVAVEMEFDVLKPGHTLVPAFHFFDEEGACVFVSSDSDPKWRRQVRPVGRFVSTTRIPGNYLAEGSLIVGAAVATLNPVVVHCHERQAVAFQMVDSCEGDSARGDYAGAYPGVVRPLLPWTTTFNVVS
jgi:lipopolysaccharide transport system ATP-binding protein